MCLWGGWGGGGQIGWSRRLAAPGTMTVIATRRAASATITIAAIAAIAAASDESGKTGACQGSPSAGEVYRPRDALAAHTALTAGMYWVTLLVCWPSARLSDEHATPVRKYSCDNTKNRAHRGSWK